MSASAFQSRLTRGVVLHVTLDSSVLDDPAISTRDKFIVILNHYCPDDPLYFVMATSNVVRFETGQRWAVIRRSRYIEPRVLPLITPGGYF